MRLEQIENTLMEKNKSLMMTRLVATYRYKQHKQLFLDFITHWAAVHSNCGFRSVSDFDAKIKCHHDKTRWLKVMESLKILINRPERLKKWAILGIFFHLFKSFRTIQRYI